MRTFRYRLIGMIMEFMIKNGLTIDEFCKRCNIDAETLVNIFTCKEYDIMLLPDIAKGMDMEFYELLGV